MSCSYARSCATLEDMGKPCEYMQIKDKILLALGFFVFKFLKKSKVSFH